MEQATMVLANLAVAAVAAFVGAYLAMKGRNLATREDVERIEHAQQRVRDDFAKAREQREHDYRLILSRLGFRHQLRLAALDRRLEAHQEAYALWRDLRPAYSADLHDHVCKCQAWWKTHNLYLSPQARSAFYDACLAALELPGLKGPNADARLIHEVWDRIEAAGPAIQRGVALPPIAETEDKPPELL